MTVNFDMNNAAFDDAPASEAARILRTIAAAIEEHGYTNGVIRDVNGNTIGSFLVEDDEQ